MISAGDFRNGVTFEMDGNVVSIIEFQHVKPGKGAAFVRTKIRNVITGAVTEKTFNPVSYTHLDVYKRQIAGCVTGFLHVKLKISDLLSGILVMTGLYSINLFITGGKATVQFYNQNTVFNSGLAAFLPESLLPYKVIFVALLVVIIVKVIMDLYLRTKSGLLLRASGDNPQYVISLGRDPGRMKIIGLAIGNGCTALSGCILSQQAETANIASGTGRVVMALASVIIGTSLFHRVRIVPSTLAVIFGAILYKTCLVAAMQLHLPTNALKLVMAVIFAIALVTNNVTVSYTHLDVYKRQEHTREERGS